MAATASINQRVNELCTNMDIFNIGELRRLGEILQIQGATRMSKSELCSKLGATSQVRLTKENIQLLLHYNITFTNIIRNTNLILL